MQYNKTFVSPELDQRPGPLFERAGERRRGVENIAATLDNRGWRVSEAQQQQDRLTAQAKVAEAVAARAVNAPTHPSETTQPPIATPNAPTDIRIDDLMTEIYGIHDTHPNQGAASLKELE